MVIKQKLNEKLTVGIVAKFIADDTTKFHPIDLEKRIRERIQEFVKQIRQDIIEAGTKERIKQMREEKFKDVFTQELIEEVFDKYLIDE